MSFACRLNLTTWTLLCNLVYYSLDGMKVYLKHVFICLKKKKFIIGLDKGGY